MLTFAAISTFCTASSHLLGQKEVLCKKKKLQQLVILQEANFTPQYFLKNILWATCSQGKETNLVQKDISPSLP